MTAALNPINIDNILTESGIAAVNDINFETELPIALKKVKSIMFGKKLPRGDKAMLRLRVRETLLGQCLCEEYVDTMLAHELGIDSITMRVISEGDGVETEWSDPVELPGLPDVPEWNDALLPDVLRRWISDITERTQCPPEYPAVGAIVSLASVIGRGCGIRPKQQDDWTVVPNLWGAVVGPPSTMKSPALRAAMEPISRLAEDESQNFEDHKFERDTIAAKQKAIQDELKKATKDDVVDLSYIRQRYEGLEHEAVLANTERRYIVYDSTVERLGELLAASPRGLLLFRDELMGFLRSMERVGHEGDRAFFLEAWNGDGRFVYDRIVRGTIKIDAACVSILGGIQPGPLGQYIRDAIDGGVGADGLMQRFQILVYPNDQGEWRNVDRWPDSEARRTVVDLFRKLATATPEELGAEIDGVIPYVRFDPEAQEFFDSWRYELENRILRSNEHEAMEGHLVKYRSLLPSLALVFHFSESHSGAIELSTVQQAAAWCDLLESHARRVYASVTASRLVGARLLLARIKTRKLKEPFSPRDVYLCGWTGLNTSETVKAALDVLEGHGYVRQDVRRPGQSGGRPGTSVYIIVKRFEDLQANKKRKSETDGEGLRNDNLS